MSSQAASAPARMKGFILIFKISRGPREPLRAQPQSTLRRIASRLSHISSTKFQHKCLDKHLNTTITVYPTRSRLPRCDDSSMVRRILIHPTNRTGHQVSWARRGCRNLPRALEVPRSSSRPRMISYLLTLRRRRTSHGSKSPTSSLAAALAHFKFATARSSRQRQLTGLMIW